MAANAQVHGPQGGPRRSSAPALTPAEFADRLRPAYRTLWLVAAGILHDRSLAEDIVQDAAVIALDKLHEFEPGTNFVAWMSQTVRFVAYNASRREARRRPTAIDESALDAHPQRADGAFFGDASALTAGPHLSSDQTHFDDHLARALATVEPVARACLLLRAVGDLNYAEISAALGIPQGTAMSHVHRTRKALRDLLVAQGGQGGRA